ncbi:MAG: hypothetical protein B7Z73_16580 [Planctomycetia bacterium 21-64-5]|nr:MAG: hypothetical protein B7Z73_16580 [Planctomycetia bacterium 21-64-5]HQU43075.1 hypothetical protein [Pirellulales bacterium]
MGAARDIVLLNAAAVLWLCGRAGDFLDAARLAGQAIDCGAAAELLQRLVERTNRSSGTI